MMGVRLQLWFRPDPNQCRAPLTDEEAELLLAAFDKDAGQRKGENDDCDPDESDGTVEA
jgi:hypothetical protein